MPAAQAVRSIPWKRILAVAQVVAHRLGEDVPARDRRHLRELVAKSKGDPRRLTRSERAEIVRILRQVDLGKLGREVAGTAAVAKVLKR